MKNNFNVNRLKTESSSRERPIKPRLLNFPLINEREVGMVNVRRYKKSNRYGLQFLSKKKLYQHSMFDESSPLPKVVSNILKISSGQKISPNDLSSLNVTTKNWCLYDLHYKKCIGFRQDYKRQVASLTKIMTTLIAIQFMECYKLSLDFKVRVTAYATALIGTTADLKEKYWISLQNLLYGVMLPSGNDAAYTLAEYIGYFISISQNNFNIFKTMDLFDLTQINTSQFVQQFISVMNDRAYQLELVNTRFSNPHGLQNALNTSSAKDIAMLSVEACKNQTFRKIINTLYKQYQMYQGVQFRKKISKRWWNTNKLLQKDWEGTKTGRTGSAGSCLASLKNGIYIVVLNSSNAQTRFTDTERIYEWYQNSPKVIQKTIKMQDHHLKERKKAKTLVYCLETLQTEDSI